MIIQTDRCVISESRYFRRNRPTGEPNNIPIKIFKTKFQSIFFQIYGIIKILISTSKINMIGTISIAGRIKENPEIQVAEKPNPLNPLMIDAIKTTRTTKTNSIRFN